MKKQQNLLEKIISYNCINVSQKQVFFFFFPPKLFYYVVGNKHTKIYLALINENFLQYFPNNKKVIINYPET